VQCVLVCCDMPCCNVLQCVAVCCVLQCDAVCCSVLRYAEGLYYLAVAVCCSVLQCVAVCCSVLQCVAVCCSVLQCVAMCDYYLAIMSQPCTSCKTLQQIAKHCKIPQLTAALRNYTSTSLQQTATEIACVYSHPLHTTHYNTLQRTASHCNTLQHIATHYRCIVPAQSPHQQHISNRVLCIPPIYPRVLSRGKNAWSRSQSFYL